MFIQIVLAGIALYMLSKIAPLVEALAAEWFEDHPFLIGSIFLLVLFLLLATATWIELQPRGWPRLAH